MERGVSMKKRHVLLFLIMGLFSVMLFGCGASNTEKNNNEEQYADEDFIKSLSKALEKRWDLSDKQAAEEKASGKKIEVASDESKKWYMSFVDAEIPEFENYKDAKFKDSKLQEKAIQYINLLNDQKASLDYFKVDFNKFLELWGKAYNQRTQLLVDFTNNYGLTVDEKHSQVLKDMMLKGQEVTKAEDNKALIKTMTDSIKFEKIEDSYGYKKYQAVVENTTGIDFSGFELSINLLDKDGVILNTTYASVGNWQKGQKAKFEFSSDKDFTSTSIVARY
jgi:hypothetical protein